MNRIFEHDFEAMLRQYDKLIDDKNKFTGSVKDYNVVPKSVKPDGQFLVIKVR